MTISKNGWYLSLGTSQPLRPDGMQAAYGYNNLNQLETATVNGHTLNIEYNELGQRTEENMPNGVVTTYQYDQNTRLTQLKHQLGETVLAGAAYELDNNGNRLSITNENNQITGFTYDPLGQLTQVTYPDGKSAQYTYDPAGNRLLTGGDAPDKLAEVSGTTSLSYDYEDRLIQVQDGTKTINYTYDGDGNLIRKTISGSETAEYEYLYDYSAGLPRLLVEKKGDNTYNYVYANRLYSRIGPDGELYYHQDGLGSTLVITDDTGTVKNRYQYDAFGNPTTLQESVENSILFTGELYDQSGFIYLRARYYDPATGRFITQDNIAGDLFNPLSQNLYAYCGNNPLNYIDPSGNTRCIPGIPNKRLTNIISPNKTGPGLNRQPIIKYSLRWVFEVYLPQLFKEIESILNSLRNRGGGKNSEFTQGTGETLGDYLTSSGKQIVLGNYTNDVTGLGTVGQIATGIFDLDLPGDIRDLTYDFSHWEWSRSHVGKTSLDGLGLLPLVGAFKYTDAVYNLRRTPDQQALHDLARESVKRSKNGNPISKEEAEILDEWAKEYNVPQHHPAYPGSGEHFPGGGYQDHTHIYNEHVPYKPGGKGY